MYINNTNKKKLVVFKHLEIQYLNQLSVSQFNEIKKKNLIGYYFGGHFNFKLKHKPDFIISSKGLISSLNLDLTGIKIIELSGFNFLPSDIQTFLSDKEDDNLIYIGDLSRSKNFLDVIKFSKKHKPSYIKAYFRINNIFDKTILKILSFIFKIKKYRIEINWPEKDKFERKYLFKKLSKSRALIATYTREGAARVIAEAEVLCKPIIFNPSMKGGSLDFCIKNENVSIDKYSNNHKFTIKNPKEKLSLYSCKDNTLIFNSFIKENFNIDYQFENDELVNAFSAHKNVLPKEISNNKTDEISDMNSFINAYSFLINKKLALSHKKDNFKKIWNLFKKNILLTLYYFKVLNQSIFK